MLAQSRDDSGLTAAVRLLSCPSEQRGVRRGVQANSAAADQQVRHGDRVPRGSIMSSRVVIGGIAAAAVIAGATGAAGLAGPSTGADPKITASAGIAADPNIARVAAQLGPSLNRLLQALPRAKLAAAAGGSLTGDAAARRLPQSSVSGRPRPGAPCGTVR
jgi:hypothetical protein